MPFPFLRTVALTLLLFFAMMSTPARAWFLSTDLNGKKVCFLSSGPLEAPGGAPVVFVELLFEGGPSRTVGLLLWFHGTDQYFEAETSYRVVIKDVADPDTLLFDGFLRNNNPTPGRDLSVSERSAVPDSVIQSFTKAILGPKDGRMYISAPGGNPPHGPFMIDTSTSQYRMTWLRQCLQNL